MDLTKKKLLGTFPIDSAGLIVPGRPDRSVLVFRQKARNQKDLDFTAERNAMPPLGSFEPDTNAIKMVSAWITSMGPAGIHGTAPARAGFYGILVRDGRIVLPAGILTGLADGNAQSGLELLDLRGRAHALEKAQDGSWTYDRQLKGIHLLAWKGHILARVML